MEGCRLARGAGHKRGRGRVFPEVVAGPVLLAHPPLGCPLEAWEVVLVGHYPGASWQLVAGGQGRDDGGGRGGL